MTIKHKRYGVIELNLVNPDVLKGERGEAFKYEDFTPEQLKALKGEKGDMGHLPKEQEELMKRAIEASGDKADKNHNHDERYIKKNEPNIEQTENTKEKYDNASGERIVTKSILDGKVQEIDKKIEDANKILQTNLMPSLEKKVDKEEGKGLSTNDFTNEEKEKIEDSVRKVEALKETLKSESESLRRLVDDKRWRSFDIILDISKMGYFISEKRENLGIIVTDTPVTPRGSHTMVYLRSMQQTVDMIREERTLFNHITEIRTESANMWVMFDSEQWGYKTKIKKLHLRCICEMGVYGENSDYVGISVVNNNAEVIKGKWLIKRDGGSFIHKNYVIKSKKEASYTQDFELKVTSYGGTDAWILGDPIMIDGEKMLTVDCENEFGNFTLGLLLSNASVEGMSSEDIFNNGSLSLCSVNVSTDELANRGKYRGGRINLDISSVRGVYRPYLLSTGNFNVYEMGII